MKMDTPDFDSRQIDLQVKVQLFKNLEYNTEEQLYDLRRRNDFLNNMQKTIITK